MSQTACTHCGSTNSIETAGQRYCADCGQLIGSNKEEKKESKREGKKPESKTVTQKAPSSKPKKTAPPLNLKAIEKSRVSGKATAVRPGALDLRNAQPTPVTKKPVGKHVPPKPRPELKHDEIATLVVAHAPIAEIKVPVPSSKFRHKLALRDALKSIFVGKTLTIALAASIITTLCESVFVAMFAKTGLYAITESYKTGSINVLRATTLTGHIAWAGLLGFVGYLIYHYALAEVIFRTSRAFDRRNATAAQARRAALGSLAGLFVVDVVTWLIAIVTFGLVVGANIGLLSTKSLAVFGIGLAALINAVAAYVWLGLIAARHMATYAIVLGQVGVRRAYTTGWSLYNREFARLTTGLIIITAVALLISLPSSVVTNSVGNGSSWAFATTTALVALTQAVTLIIGAVYYLRLYRFLITRQYDSELGHLLSGRQPRKSHVGRRLIALGIITVVWMAVMTSLIVYATPIAKALFR